MKQVVTQGARALRRGGLAALVAAAAMAAALFVAPGFAAAAGYDPVTATVPVEVSVAGDKPAKDETFKFTMTPADDEDALPARDTQTIVGAGEASFSLTFDEVGEHHYTVTQTPGKAGHWTYDTRVYDVTVYCMWNEKDDTLFTEVVIKDVESGKKAESCAFVNTYDAPELPKTGDEPKPEKPAGVLPSTGDTAMLPIVAACAVGVVAVAAGVVSLRKRRDAESRSEN